MLCGLCVAFTRLLQIMVAGSEPSSRNSPLGPVTHIHIETQHIWVSIRCDMHIRCVHAHHALYAAIIFIASCACRREGFPDTADAAVSRLRELGVRSTRERELEATVQERAEMEEERVQISSWEVRLT